MLRVPLLILLLAPAVSAQDAMQRYMRLIDEARAIYWSDDRSLDRPAKIDRAYEILAQAAQLLPMRWEAFLERGFNRCMAILFARDSLRDTLVYERSRGATESQLAVLHRAAKVWIGDRLKEAVRDFKIMERRMFDLGEMDRDVVDFASGAIKFANREYEKARGGRPGAIKDFQRLHSKGFLKERCAEAIALCYLDIAYQKFEAEDFKGAQQAWDDALNWTRNQRLRELIRTNKAGAFEYDNEYERAQNILLEQIEEEPYRPVHYKNMGLILGYQNKLREALYYYRRCRELARGDLAFLHGNAWLRAAVTHAKLLEQDGDLLLAWKLFAEYRMRFGDDYNFSFAFGDICAKFGQYEIAQAYYERARDLQPHCPAPYQKLVEIALRHGTRETATVRLKKAKADFEVAQARYNAREENPAVHRACGGLRDLADTGLRSFNRALLSPDPLAGYGVGKPPPWLLEAAKSRSPFVPWEPEVAPADEKKPDVAELARQAPLALWIGVGIGAVVLVVAVFVLFGRRPKQAA